jgi:ubiquinol-cytochrome c reductase cytochrome c subunit
VTIRRRLPGPLLVLIVGLGSFAVLALGSHVGAHAQTGTPDPNAFTPEEVAAGRDLYVVHCSSCHGAVAAGTDVAPALTNAGAASADFYLRTGRMPLSDYRQQAVRHRPAFADPQIRQLDAYVASLGPGPPIPTVAAGALAAGNQLFSINCAQCHNDAGAGGALGYGDIVPPLNRASPVDIAEAMRVGPDPMPVFGPDTLSDQQVADVAAYVQYLHHPEDRGGLGLGHLGPIPEGFVGWVVGMGLLLLAARLIGTRA